MYRVTVVTRPRPGTEPPRDRRGKEVHPTPVEGEYDTREEAHTALRAAGFREFPPPSDFGIHPDKWGNRTEHWTQFAEVYYVDPHQYLPLWEWG